MHPPQNGSTPTPESDTKPIATQWTTGDFTLISSDNHIFKIESRYLQCASPVFRTDFPVGDTRHNTVEFTDETLETTLIIGHFLTLITTGKLDDDLGSSPRYKEEFGKSNEWEYRTAILYDLCGFLVKYDCVKEVKVLLQYVSYGIMTRQLRFFSGFLLAAIAEKAHDCVAFLAADTAARDVWSKGSSDARTKRFLGDRPVMDPRVMPHAWYKRIPCDYVWALTQAWDVSTPNGGLTVAVEFEKLIKRLNRKYDLCTRPTVPD